MAKTETTRRDLYQTVTDQIIAQLEAGTVPWVRPWDDRGGNGVALGLPYNAASKRQYSGINVPILWSTAKARGYAGGGWLTFNQARKAGGMVRKGERGTMVVFAKQITREDEETGKRSSFPVLQSFVVFHTSQCDGLPEEIVAQPEAPRIPVSAVLDWVQRAGAEVRHGGNRAFYTTAGDYVQMPPCEAFRDMDHYAATLLHEATHWSGGPKRLNRVFGKRFGDDAYAAEELVAEMGSAFLCARLGVRGELQHANYLASWIKVLKADKRAIFTAASAASKAADYLADLAGAEEHEESETVRPVPSNVILLPAPAPVLALPSPEMIRRMYGKPDHVKPKPKAKRVHVEPIPHADDYTARGDQNAVSLLGLALAAQSDACRKQRRYVGAFPLSAHQKRLYADGIGHASGYWRAYAADQSRKPAPNPRAVADELIRVWERSGHIPSAASCAGNSWLEDWRAKAEKRAESRTRWAEAAE